MVKKNFRILVCPLDWGIGHATRCVPVIRQLIHENHEVIIAADGGPLDFLREYFPELEFVRLPGFRVTYPSGNNMILKMIVQSPEITVSIYKEHRQLKKIIKDYMVDVVISDNRFGLWSKDAYSVYMTHQVMIKAKENMSWAAPLLYRIHRWFMKKYDECWVPDLPGERNLSGDLGHKQPLPINGSFIGILSRFSEDGGRLNPPVTSSAPDLLVLLSGPEPQRTILEKLVLMQLEDYRDLDVVILQGLPGKPEKRSPLPRVRVFNHLPDGEISKLISHAGVIICRPGYSTVMDLAVLGRSAVLVPTPGQTEQEYLAGYLSAKGSFVRMVQASFTLNEALAAGRKLPENFDFETNGSLLERRVIALQEKVFLTAEARRREGENY